MTKPLGHDLNTTPAEIAELLPYLTEDERAEIAELMARDAETYIWRPLPGPQYMAYMSQADDTGYGGAAGGGKAQTLENKALSPKGWVRLGDVEVGDTLTDPTTGGACEVIGVFPQGEQDIYEIEFDDGAVTRAVDWHLWAYKPNGHTNRRPGTKASAQREFAAKALGAEAPTSRWDTLRIGTTEDLAAQVAAGDLPRVPLMEPALFTVNGRTGASLDPYFLGMFLGDGCARHLTIASADPEAWPYLAEQECSQQSVKVSWCLVKDKRKKMDQWLRDHGLRRSYAWEKFVPKYVFTAGVEYRLAFLQGLFDTDGTADDRGRCYFTSTSEALAQGVVDLARSLGGKASLRLNSTKTYTHNGEKRDGRPSWQVRVWMRRNSALFRLSRKKARCTDSWNGGHELMREVVRVEKVGREEAVCIKVSSPRGLYVTDDYIVTHNTDLMCGAALTQHHQSLLMRREYTQMKGIVQRMTEMLGSRDGYNGSDKIWRIPTTGRTIEFGSVPNLGDELNFQGRPRDLLGIDEATNFLRAQVVFLMGWVRTTKTGQRTRTINTFNPPTTVEGRWVIDHYAPWLDEDSLIPASPGEIRWFAMVDGEEVEVSDARQFVLDNGTQVFDFDPRAHHPTKIIRPSSRTFIPSRISDNPFLVSTGYISTLQRMPEPLRSQMLYGDFKAGMQDDIWQVIPTAWVDAAMARWKPKARKGEMMALGVDVARGGKDKTLLSPRYDDWWFDELIEFPGKETPDGHAVAGQVVVHHRDNAPILIDVIGVGASPYDILSGKDQPVYGVDVRNTPTGTDKSGMMTFKNLRSQLIWGLREMLDPANNLEPSLPNDPVLKKELCSVLWRYQNATCYVESREEIVGRIGHSPDKLSALMLAAMDVPKVKKHQQQNVQQAIDVRKNYDPFKR